MFATWQEHKTKAEICGDIPPISSIVACRRTGSNNIWCDFLETALPNQRKKITEVHWLHCKRYWAWDTRHANSRTEILDMALCTLSRMRPPSSSSSSKRKLLYSLTAVDTNPPVISGCPATQVVTVASGTTSAVVSWTQPTASDAEGTASIVQSSGSSSGSLFPIGTTNIVYTATDQSGLQATCGFNIIVSSSTGNELATGPVNDTRLNMYTNS